MSLLNLPEGWIVVQLGDICSKVTDGSHNPPSASIEGLPMLSAKNIHDGIIDFDADHRLIPLDAFEQEDKRTKITANDVLLTIVGALGRAAIVQKNTPKFTLQRSVAVLAAPMINPGYLKFLLEEDSFQRQILDNAKGTAQKGIYLKSLKELKVAVAPLAEQQQIAQKLDELLAQVDTLKTRLDAIPKILKRFRQSVLAAAVSGRLTEEWRGENHAPLWRNVPLGEISTFQNGFAFKSEWFSSAGDCQVMKLGNIKNDGLRFETSPAFVDNNTAELHKKYKPDYEDILITMTGTKYKRDYGFTCIVPKNTQILINQRVGRIISDKSQVIPRYLLIFLQSKIFLDEFFKGETGGVNQGNVGSEHIKSCVVALPSLEEQTEIVRRVEQLFTYADQIEQRVKDAQARVNHLTQSILAKAFRGELTADWRARNPELISGENSAAALLERIKAEREDKEVKKGARKPKLAAMK